MSHSVSDDVAASMFADRIAELRELSRFLHDTITQELVALSFVLSRLELMTLSTAARTDVETALGMLDHCCRDVRLIGTMLTPPSLADIALDAAIVQLAHYLSGETDTPVKVDLGPIPALPPESQLFLLACVQTWFARAIRNKTAGDLLVRLREKAGTVVLELGMSPPPADALSGWTVLRERARTLNGEFSIENRSGRLIALASMPGHHGA